jgi:integrase
MAKIAKGLTINQRKNGSWRAQIRRVGYPHESKDFLTRADASEWGIRRLADIGIAPRLIDTRMAQRTTLAQCIDQYIDEVTAKRPSQVSSEAETSRLRRFQRTEVFLCGHALANLTPEHFEDWRDRRSGEKISRGIAEVHMSVEPSGVPKGRFKKDGSPRKNAAKPKPAVKELGTVKDGTIKREMTLLKRVLDFGMKRHKLQSNPLDRSKVERPVVQDERQVSLTSEGKQRLLAECRAARNPWLAPFVELAFEVGARRGSLLKLDWADVHIAENMVYLRGVKNSRKPSEERNVEVGLSPEAIVILEALPRNSSPKVFPVSANAIKLAFERARERAGLPHFRLHDARHVMAGELVEAGWSILDVMAQGDWRDPKSVARYYTARGAHLGAKLAEKSRKGRLM